MPHTNPDLRGALEDAASRVEVGAYYYHFRSPGKRYQVVDLGIIEATEEVAVLYRITDGKTPDMLWIRPLSSFTSMVEHEGRMVPRFTKVS